MLFGGTVYPTTALMSAARRQGKGRGFGWEIGSADLRVIVAALPGTPVTFDHSATLEAAADVRPTRDAIERLGIEQFTATKNPDLLLKCPVGRVLSAFVDRAGAARVTIKVTRGVADLLSMGMYAHLSLSHYAGTTAPLEVAVTSDPGRPGCRVDAVVHSPGEYKDIVAQRIATATMATTPTPLETAMATMSEADRTLVCERLLLMQQRADTAVAERQRLETTAATEQDYRTLKSTTKMLINHLPPDVQARFNVNEDLVTEACKQNTPERMRINTLDAMLMACNATMSAMAAPAPASGLKRARVEREATLTHDAPSADKETNLARALAEAFEPKNLF